MCTYVVPSHPVSLLVFVCTALSCAGRSIKLRPMMPRVQTNKNCSCERLRHGLNRGRASRLLSAE